MADSRYRWQCPNEWSEWSDWLAAGLHARNRWRLPVLLAGMLFAQGCRYHLASCRRHHRRLRRLLLLLGGRGTQGRIARHAARGDFLECLGPNLDGKKGVG